MSDDTSKLLKACVEYRAMVDKLEAENAALRKAKEMVELERCEMMRSMSLAQNQSQQLRADKARLDWFINLDEEDRVKFCRGWDRWTPEEVKAEIDAELRKEAQP